MSLDLRNELRRAAANSEQPPHDYAGDLTRGQQRLRRHRMLVAASAVPVVAAAVAAIVVGPQVISDKLSSPPPIAASPTDPASSLLPSPSPTNPAPPKNTSVPSDPGYPGRAPVWHVTNVSLKGAVRQALKCQIVSGLATSCNGSAQGKAALAYWTDARAVVFGDPAYGEPAQAPVGGSQGVAYPSEAWQALAPYLVNATTGPKITAWLQQHNYGRTVIDSVHVGIAGPIASVGSKWVPLSRNANAGAHWKPTMASLKRDVPKALGCTVTAGEMVWVCNGSTQGKAAKAYWSNARGIAFGDPRAGEHPYLRQSGTSGVAYPSEVWRAIAPYLVPSSTADKITVWLQNHNSGSTTIDGLRVQINGPIAGVGLH